MEYEIEQLLPIVSKLAERFTAYESSSVTYETAQQLMGAVVYTINELNDSQIEALTNINLSPQNAYEAGKQRVKEKGEASLALYRHILELDSNYENIFLTSAIQDFSVFFKKYDDTFCPQENVIFFDYPLLAALPEQSGVDKVFNYLKIIQMELEFLNTFKKEEVIKRLDASMEDYRNTPLNLCKIMIHSLFDDFISRSGLTLNIQSEDESTRIRSLFFQAIIKETIDTPQLREYLSIAIKES